MRLASDSLAQGCPYNFFVVEGGADIGQKDPKTGKLKKKKTRTVFSRSQARIALSYMDEPFKINQKVFHL